MHHPWHWLRDHLPEWNVLLVAPESGAWGENDPTTRTIWIDPLAYQAERRCTLQHELEHIRAGDVGPQPLWREEQVRRAAARRLIAIDALVDAVKWAHDREELADDLFVDVETLMCRLEHLHPAERAAVCRAIAEREFHEEGWG